MTKLFRVTVPVTDLSLAVRFYQRLLGIDGERSGVAWHSFQLGAMVLACYDPEADGDPPLPALQAPIYLGFDDLPVQMHLRAQHLGARHVDAQISKLPSGEMGFAMRDPFGNALCMVESRNIIWGQRHSARAQPAPVAKAPVLMFQQDFLNAVKGGEFARVKELVALDAELANLSDHEGVSALLLAAYKRNERIATYLMGLRESLSIWEAAAMGAIEPLRQLLDERPELVNATASDGFLPLGLACFFGHEDAVRLLLERGADVNLASRNRMAAYPVNSAMTHAPPERAVAILHLLLRAGADVNARQCRGHTPLHQAASRGASEVVELLLAAGADAGARADNGATPADLARAGRLTDTMALLARYGERQRA
ncbi:MAG TPA: ankyrin repeat domain-containing protein [Solimonas sp.]|nr:ankyrin repeat domain-containing protein [Solimonas sp.]